MRDYNQAHCWQYDIRKRNFASDLLESGLTEEEISSLAIHDFTFDYIPSTDKYNSAKISDFIKRHEWLGKMPNRPTHRFVALYKGMIAGVIVMATPNSFSHLLGKDNKNLEKLISRGACISWSPKNLGSALVMYSIRWMVRNTSFRIFTAYSDTEAKELGTIYQACNFIYLGKNSGASFEYFDEESPKKGWFSDRQFRKVGQYKKYAKRLDIVWDESWNTKWTVHWDKMPEDVVGRIKQESKDHQSQCKQRPLDSKHKYCYILGTNKKETRELKILFEKFNPKKINLKYPKVRGE